MTGARLSSWLALSRLPFHSVGVLPFALGTLLAWRQGGVFHWDVCLWGVAGVVLIMLASYYAGEYWDYAEDTLAASTGHSRFAGGSGVLQRGLLPRRAALWASLASLLLAAAVGLVLVFCYQVGIWAIPLGAVGMVGGFFYSTRPLRWVRTGWGEVWIAVCYGWLPVAAGHYLQVGTIEPLVHGMAIPIGLTIFNVVLLNEFPDYSADRATGKANLAVRLGLEGASRLYGLVSLASWIAVALSLCQGVPLRALWFYLPVLVVSVTLVVAVLREQWRERAALERLCAANLIVNLGTTAAYAIALLI